LLNVLFARFIRHSLQTIDPDEPAKYGRNTQLRERREKEANPLAF
jgi:hypothetical protein